MGVEYEAHLNSVSAETVHRLFDALEADARWRVVRRGDDEIALAYAGEPSHPKWPERIVVHIAGSRLYALFHSGTDAQRRALLAVVTEIIACTLNEM